MADYFLDSVSVFVAGGAERRRHSHGSSYNPSVGPRMLFVYIWDKLF